MPFIARPLPASLAHGRCRLLLTLPVAVCALSAAVLAGGAWSSRASAAPGVTGVTDSTITTCMIVGSNAEVTQEVVLRFSGTPTAARLIAYEFGMSAVAGNEIYINDVLIGQPVLNSPYTDGPHCEINDPDQQWAEWDIAPSILISGTNRIRLVNRSTDTDGWGLVRAKIQVTGPDVNGVRFEEFIAPSTYYNNWNGYKNEGTWTQIQLPSSYDGSQPVPLLVGIHGLGDTRVVPILDLSDAAESRGWLLASPELHGETKPINQPVGHHVFGAPASQWDVMDAIRWIKANYNVDESRIYLVGHSLGAITAGLVAAKWPQEITAAVADSGPTDLVKWEYEMQPGGITPNYNNLTYLHQECGGTPSENLYCYERRSLVQYAPNFRHMPLLIVHGEADTKVDPHHAQDFYNQTQLYAPDRVELWWHPGGHGERYPDFANAYLSWLAQFARSDMPSQVSFRRDEPGRTYWVTIAQSAQPAATGQHWTSVWSAAYTQADDTVIATVEDATGASVGLDLGAVAPGEHSAAGYILEDLDKDTATFTARPVASAGGLVTVTVSPGAHRYQIYPGATPLPYATVTLRQGASGYAGAADTFLSAWEPDTPNVTSQVLRVRHEGPTTIRNALLRFDLAGQMPPDAWLRGAVLNLYATWGPADRRLVIDLHQVARPWKVDEATWNHPQAGETWAMPGANGMPGDIAGQPADRRAVQASASGDINRWYGWDVTDLAAAWLATPEANYGVALRAAPPKDDYDEREEFVFASSDSPYLAQRPQLTLIYALVTPMPTPTPTLAATPTPTVTPTPTPTPTPLTGEVRGHAFLDESGDGIRQVEEPGLPGVTVTLRQGETVVSTQTTGADGAFAFTGITPGPYVLTAEIPAGFRAVSVTSIGVDVVGGWTVEWDFAYGRLYRVYLPVTKRES